MNLERIIKDFMQSILNRKNYRLLIIGLLAVIVLFLWIGNYNLVLREGNGTTLSDRTRESAEKVARANEKLEIYKGIEAGYNAGQESMKNCDMDCTKMNFNNAGAPGNNGANSMNNEMCNMQKKLCEKNQNN